MNFDGGSSSRPLWTVSRNTASGTDADRKVDAIIAGFPGPVALRVSRLKCLGLLAFSLAFACSIYVIHDGSMSSSGPLKAMATLAFDSNPNERHNSTNCPHTFLIAPPLSLRKSAMVL